MLKKNINGKYVAIFFIHNDKHYFALFEGRNRLYKVVCNLDVDPFNPAIYTNSKKQIIYYEKPHVSKKFKKTVSEHKKSVTLIT